MIGAQKDDKCMDKFRSDVCMLKILQEFGRGKEKKIILLLDDPDNIDNLFSCLHHFGLGELQCTSETNNPNQFQMTNGTIIISLDIQHNKKKYELLFNNMLILIKMRERCYHLLDSSVADAIYINYHVLLLPKKNDHDAYVFRFVITRQLARGAKLFVFGLKTDPIMVDNTKFGEFSLNIDNGFRNSDYAYWFISQIRLALDTPVV